MRTNNYENGIPILRVHAIPTLESTDSYDGNRQCVAHSWALVHDKRIVLLLYFSG